MSWTEKQAKRSGKITGWKQHKNSLFTRSGGWKKLRH